MQSWRVIAYHVEIKERIKYCADVLNKRYANKKVVMICVLKGAVFFYVDLLRSLTIPYSCYFVGASSYLDGQIAGAIKVDFVVEPSKFTDREVIIVDELYDNGHTLEKVTQAISKEASVPLDKIYTCTLFWKYKIGVIGPNLYGLVVPNVWLVGYGLDDKQEKRGLVDLWAVPKEPGVTETEDDQLFTDDVVYKQIRSQILERVGLL